MNTHRFLGAVAAAAMAASQADATNINVTFRGVVANGFDQTGVFGAPNTSLNGDPFVLNLALSTPYNDDFYANPPLDSGIDANDEGSGTLAINGRSYSFGAPFGDTGGFSYYQSAGAAGRWGLSSGIYGNSIWDMNGWEYINQPSYGASVFSTTDQFVKSYDFHHYLYHVVAPGDTATGGFTISDYAVNIGPEPPMYFDVASGDLDITSVSVGVPEPATWAMMILGLAGVGLAARRRTARPPACPL